ncbi:MAG: hypothetical protein ACRC7P_01305, partial [Enterovibrio sp.]
MEQNNVNLDADDQDIIGKKLDDFSDDIEIDALEVGPSDEELTDDLDDSSSFSVTSKGSDATQLYLGEIG